MPRDKNTLRIVGRNTHIPGVPMEWYIILTGAKGCLHRYWWHVAELLSHSGAGTSLYCDVQSENRNGVEHDLHCPERLLSSKKDMFSRILYFSLLLCSVRDFSKYLRDSEIASVTAIKKIKCSRLKKSYTSLL